MPKYSIITVCMNEATNIRKTAESIMVQTCRDFEWLVQDGGSTDGTVEILDAYRGQMTHFESVPDSGVYDAMNRAVRRARGDWLLFLNGGDALVAPSVLEEVAPLLGGRNKDIWVGDCLCVWPDGRPPVRKSHPKSINLHHFYRCTVSHQAAFIGARVFEIWGPYNLSFRWLADYDFFVRCALGGVAFRSGDVLVAKYDMTGISSTVKNAGKLQAEWRQVRRRFPLTYRFRRILNDAYLAWRSRRARTNQVHREGCEHGK